MTKSEFQSIKQGQIIFSARTNEPRKVISASQKDGKTFAIHLVSFRSRNGKDTCYVGCDIHGFKLRKTDRPTTPQYTCKAKRWLQKLNVISNKG